MPTRLSLRDALLALAVVFIWGTNFVVIRIGLNTLPPLLFAALRFLFVLLPACFFLKRPPVRMRLLAMYGVSLGVIQFGLLFIAMRGMISPGLASLVVQMQVFFTVGIAMWRQGEKLQPHQLAAFALALAGMAVIAAHNGHGATVQGLLLVLAAGMGWALSNQAAREAAREATAQGHSINMLALVVWGSLFAVPPLFALSLVVEGPAAIAHGVMTASALTWVAVIWQSVGNTMFGYGTWAWLLSRYPAATVSPLSLLVSVFGFGASAVLLGEPLPLWKIGATLLILAGLAINLLWRPHKIELAGEPD